MNKPYSKHNPRPKPIRYEIDFTKRKRFPFVLFKRDPLGLVFTPIPEAMERYRDQYHKYPAGIIPIYEEAE